MTDGNRDWTKYQLMSPPDDATGRQVWVADAFWILFGKINEIQQHLASHNYKAQQVDTAWARISGYVKAIAAVGVLLYALSAIIANIAAALSMFKG